MEKLTFAQLTSADERTRRFSPYGLATGSRILAPESAAEFQQSCIASADLDPAVPESTRAGFERLRLFHSYGVLCYELFTVTDDLSWVVLEQALRERFLAFYSNRIPIIDTAGKTAHFDAPTFDAISDAFRRGGGHAKGWMLDTSAAKPARMPLTLDPLIRWAHGAGLLDGQRNRRVQLAVYADLRNHFAHGGGIQRIGMPNDSARSIRDLGEVINRLWGRRTPGGRLYPAPVERRPVVLAWTDGWGSGAPGSMFTQFELHHLSQRTGDGLTCVVVRASAGDEDLADFDARYELTPLPAEWLFGPCSFSEAVDWLATHEHLEDEVEIIDRLFAIRLDAGKVFLPMRPAVAKAVPLEVRIGRWRIVRADYPNDAWGHVRHHLHGEPCPDPKFGGCPVTDLVEGTWAEIIAVIDDLQPGLAAVEYVAAAVPRRHAFPDEVGYE